ncbi:lysophospholipid acyltransferase family protein [Marinilabiliaceae bacterium ANBcel2]|nr:lysophospholipid acyltransferase family protein [Marinilabiliaceae bacterium ANBcel2]
MSIATAVGFYTIYPLLWGVSFLPFFLLYRLSDFFYLFMLLFGYRKKVISSNLKKAYPLKDRRWRDKIRYQFYRHLCDVFVETIALHNKSPKKISQRVEVENLELLKNSINQGRDAIAFLGHYGNWEWIPSVALKLPEAKGLSVYRPLKNRYFDRYMLNLRSVFGSDNIPKKNTVRTIIKYKRDNKRFVLGLIADQSPGRNELDYWTTFLNQRTPVITGPEKLSRISGTDLFFWKIRKVTRGRYSLKLVPYPRDPSKAPEGDITEWCVRQLEEQINEDPRFWLWSHRRWKYQHLYNSKKGN